MAYLVRDTNPRYGGGCYFVGTRKIKDPHGRDCEAADFGDKEHAKRFTKKSEANDRAAFLNRFAPRKNQFVVEEDSIYSQRYGQRRASSAPREHGGFKWVNSDDWGRDDRF